MSELERLRQERDVHLSRGHLRAAMVGTGLLCALAFLLGVQVGGRVPAAPAAVATHAPTEDLVELLARVEASDELRDGVEELTFPDALTRSSGGTAFEGEREPEGPFRVEVARFTDVAEARRLRDELRLAGAPVWVGAQLEAGVMSWRVSSGAFQTHEAATEHVTALSSVLSGWAGVAPAVVAR